MDDLIYRSAAIEEIQNAYCDTEGGEDKCAVWKNVGLTEALHIIQDVPAAQPEQRWIPCSERLPEEERNIYWVYTDFGSMHEYAWTSFQENAKVFEFAPQGKADDKRFHPTQKPVELYRWIFSRYAKPGDRILDTHLGSGSSRIAAYDAGLDFWGYEIDPGYFAKEEERFNAYASQLNLFLEES